MTRITDTPITDAAWYSSDNNDDRCDALNQACEKLERENAELLRVGCMLATRLRHYIPDGATTTDTINHSLLRSWQRAITQTKG